MHNVFTRGQIVKMRQTLLQPFLVRMFTRQLQLDFIVVNQSTLCSVNKEHTSRLQTSFSNDARLVNIENASFTRKNNEVVACHPVTPWTKSISVKHCTNESSVSERNVCWSIPWLHERRVELVERTLAWIHSFIVFPRLGNHHEKRMW